MRRLRRIDVGNASCTKRGRQLDLGEEISIESDKTAALLVKSGDFEYLDDVDDVTAMLAELED